MPEHSEWTDWSDMQEHSGWTDWSYMPEHSEWTGWCDRSGGRFESDVSEDVFKVKTFKQREKRNMTRLTDMTYKWSKDLPGLKELENLEWCVKNHNKGYDKELTFSKAYPDDFDQRKTTLFSRGMTVRITLQWLPPYEGSELLAFVVTPLKGLLLSCKRPEFMHISIGFRNELVGPMAEVAMDKLKRRWNNKIVHCNFNEKLTKNTTGYFSFDTAFMRDSNLRYLHSLSTRYKDRHFHVSMSP